MPRASWRERGSRAWDIEPGVTLWCRTRGGWRVEFAPSGRTGLYGSWTWRVTADQARLLIGLVQP